MTHRCVERTGLGLRPRHNLAAAAAIMAGVAFGLAIACAAQLAAPLSEADPSGSPTGLDAALVIAEAVQRVELALPVLVRTQPDVRELTDRQARAVSYLYQRGLLTDRWERSILTHEMWRHAVRTWLSWYGLAPPDIPVPSTREELVDAVGAILELVSSELRPALLFTVGHGDARSISFRGLIWNWSVYPRLIVVPPLDGSRAPLRVEQVVASVESCAVDVQHWLSLSDDAARRLFLERRPPRMVVVGTEPDRPDLTPWWVPIGEELDVLAYAHPAVRDLEAFSVVFTGDPLPFTAWLRLLPNVRTNASPVDLRRYLQTPPSVGGR